MAGRDFGGSRMGGGGRAGRRAGRRAGERTERAGEPASEGGGKRRKSASEAVRVPGRANIPFKNSSPLFYTARVPIRCAERDPAAAETLNSMMLERFVVFNFSSPLPLESRLADWKHCGACFARFVLTHSGPAPEDS